MEFKDIASVAGKGGLFKVVKPTKAGVILESLDDKKSKFVAGMSTKVSLLEEISIYTNTEEGTIALSEVLIKIHSEFGDDPGVEKNDASEDLKSFLAHVVPDYDREKVYTSDIKKLVNWYHILCKEAPALLKENNKDETPKDSSEEKDKSE